MKMKESLKTHFLVEGWLVLLLCLGFGGALSAIQMKLHPIIEENKKNEIFRTIPGLIFKDYPSASTQAGSHAITPLFVKSQKQGGKRSYAVFQVKDPKGDIAGWAVRGAGQGYADRIELILGLSPSADTVTGLFILEQKETPGLGNKINEVKWREQFIGKKTESALSAVKGRAMKSNEIDAISGATISSVSVCRIINQMVADVKAPLKTKWDETRSDQ